MALRLGLGILYPDHVMGSSADRMATSGEMDRTCIKCESVKSKVCKVRNKMRSHFFLVN